VRGSAINYLGNPRFRPQCAFKAIISSEDMERCNRMLDKHAILITDDGPLAVHSREDAKDLIQ
jgi:hypothetical protein